MSCASCSADNTAPRRFCRSCGASLGAPCRRCGFLNEARDLYCGGCGGALGAACERATPSHQPPIHSAVAPVRQGAALSERDLRSLLAPGAPLEPALPANLTQEDLDQLFGVE